MALGEGRDHGAALPLIADQAKHGAGGIVRSGSMWTAAAHVITAVIGSGVLSLAWSIAQLGWVAGPGAMLVFAAVTALQSTLFADCYRSPDPEHGPHRNRTYAKAVDRNLGVLCSSSEEGCWLPIEHRRWPKPESHTGKFACSYEETRIRLWEKGELLPATARVGLCGSVEFDEGL